MQIDKERLAEARRRGEVKRIPMIRSEEEDLFRKIVVAAQPKRILEIGTGNGYSALCMAAWAPQAEIVTIESFQERYETAQAEIHAAGLQERVRLCFGLADDCLRALHGTFDFLYLDGPKGHYLEHLLLAEKHLTEDAVVVADNVLFRGYVYQEVPIPRRMRTIAYRMRDYLHYVSHTGKYATQVYRVGDGLSVSYRKGKK